MPTVILYFLLSLKFDFGLIVNLVELTFQDDVYEKVGEKLSALMTEALFIGSEKRMVISGFWETFFALSLGEKLNNRGGSVSYLLRVSFVPIHMFP